MLPPKSVVGMPPDLQLTPLMQVPPPKSGGNAPRPTFDTFNASASRQMSLDGSGPSSSIRVQEFQSASCGRGASKISVSASKLKSVDEVMQNNLELCTPSNIKTLTRKLAREAFFGDQVLLLSTVTGKSGIPLDEHKLDMLQTVLQLKYIQIWLSITLWK